MNEAQWSQGVFPKGSGARRSFQKHHVLVFFWSTAFCMLCSTTASHYSVATSTTHLHNEFAKPLFGNILPHAGHCWEEGWKRSVIAPHYNHDDMSKVWCVWVVDVVDVESWHWALTDNTSYIFFTVGRASSWPQNCCKHKNQVQGFLKSRLNATEVFLKNTESDWNLVENQYHWRLLENTESDYWKSMPLKASWKKLSLTSSWKSDWIWLKVSWKTLISLNEVFLKNRLNLTEGFLTNWSTESFLTDSLSPRTGGEQSAPPLATPYERGSCIVSSLRNQIRLKIILKKSNSSDTYQKLKLRNINSKLKNESLTSNVNALVALIDDWLW